MLQCESSWTWWELLMKFFHDCNIAVTQIGCCESKLTPKWFSFCERMPVEAQACSNLLIFMLQQSATRVSQLKTVARLRRRRRRKSATLWGMIKGWKSITLTLQIQNNSAVFCATESFKIVATSCHLLSGMKLIYLCIPPHHSCVLLCMATLFVWYNGKVLHTWHYNWLAGVCFLNNNPPPARALRNVITINLNDQSWGGLHVRHDAIPNVVTNTTTQMCSTQSLDDTVWQVASLSEILIDEWWPSMPSCIWYLVLDQFMSGLIRCEDLGGDTWWQSCDSTWPDKRRQYLKYQQSSNSHFFSPHIYVLHIINTLWYNIYLLKTKKPSTIQFLG